MNISRSGFASVLYYLWYLSIDDFVIGVYCLTGDWFSLVDFLRSFYSICWPMYHTQAIGHYFPEFLQSRVPKFFWHNVVTVWQFGGLWPETNSNPPKYYVSYSSARLGLRRQLDCCHFFYSLFFAYTVLDRQVFCLWGRNLREAAQAREKREKKAKKM